MDVIESQDFLSRMVESVNSDSLRDKSIKIRKASSIKGRGIVLRNAIVDDAEFIISLRTDDLKSKFLSKTTADVEKQKHWLESYNDSVTQAYFIIENSDGRKIGTVRMYDPQKNSFCWGSWILCSDAPKYAAIESAILVYMYSLYLGFTQAHFDVRKKNHSVCRFHESFGAVKVDENELDNFYQINTENIVSSIKKYKKYLPSKIEVIF